MSERPEDVRMSIGEHIDELRRRILYAAYVFGAVFFIVFMFHEPMRKIVLRPIERAIEMAAKSEASKHGPKPHQIKTIVVGPGFEWTDREKGPQGTETEIRRFTIWPLVVGEVLDNKIDTRTTVLSPQELVFQDVKLAMLLALLISAPVFIYHLWAFVRAGLYPHEQSAIAPYLPLAILLFVGGVAFSYYLMVPYVFSALLGWGSSAEVKMEIRLQEGLSLFYTFSFALGVLFEIPVAMMMLAHIGFVKAATFLRVWRWAILGAFVVGAVVNPAPEILTQILFAAPIVALYFLGYGLAVLVEGRARRTAA